MILQMQRESIASQEEQAREAARTQRRTEVEEQQEKQAIQHEEYFQSVLEASQAALRAPRGAYYRKPGESTQEAPAAAQEVEVDGVAYLYERGVFWTAPGPPFIVVVAPYGAVVDKLPAGAYRLPGKEVLRYYSFGVFSGEGRQVRGHQAAGGSAGDLSSRRLPGSNRRRARRISRSARRTSSRSSSRAFWCTR